MPQETEQTFRHPLEIIVMRFDSKFNIGDKVWVAQGGVCSVELTVGQITVSQTDSQGRPGEEMFDNYKPQKKYIEQYMCEETGIGSGAVFTLGKNIFSTKEECESAIGAAA